VGNLHQIFSDRERLAYITQGCTQATITCVECKALAIQSVNAHLEPMRERRRKLAAEPGKLMEVVRYGAEKATKTAEETMVQARSAVGLLQINAVRQVASRVPEKQELRVSVTALSEVKTDEEAWSVRTQPWLEHVVKTYPLKKDRPRTFITRKGRKVGVYATPEMHGAFHFEVEDRPVNVLVLLAQDDHGLLRDFILPPKLVQENWKRFVRRNGYVDVILRRSTEGAVLLLSDGSVPVDQFESDYSPLQ
jgi:hypothetical protein